MPPQHRKSTVTDHTRKLIQEAADALHAARTRAAKWAAKDFRDEVIRRVYLDGTNTHDIVVLFAQAGEPISRQQVVRIHGAADRPPLFDVAAAVKRYDEGASLRELGRAYGCAPKVVQRALVEAGVEIRDRETAKLVHYATTAPTIDVDDAAHRYREGETVHALAKHYGCSDNKLREALVEAGVEIRDRAEALRLERARVAAGLATRRPRKVKSSPDWLTTLAQAHAADYWPIGDQPEDAQETAKRIHYAAKAVDA